MGYFSAASHCDLATARIVSLPRSFARRTLDMEQRDRWKRIICKFTDSDHDVNLTMVLAGYS